MFHINRSFWAIVPAVVLWRRTKGWLRNSIVAAFSFFFIAAVLKLPDMSLGEVHENIFTPISRSFYLLAIPIFGYVYLCEQWSERKRAEVALQFAYSQLETLVEKRTAELRLSTEMTNAIVDNARDSIVTVDASGKMLTLNPATELLFGYSSEELLGQDIELIIPNAALSIHGKVFNLSNQVNKRSGGKSKGRRSATGDRRFAKKNRRENGDRYVNGKDGSITVNDRRSDKGDRRDGGSGRRRVSDNEVLGLPVTKHVIVRMEQPFLRKFQ